MHILITAVSTMHSPSGICRHAANLAACLAGSGAVSRVTLVVGSWQARYFAESFELRHAKLEIVAGTTDDNSIGRNYWYLRALPRFVRNHRPDVVHLSFPAPITRSLGCPVVSTVHDVYPYDLPDNFRFAFINRAILRQSLRNSNRIVCVSGSTERRVRFLFPSHSHKVSTIYNCAAPSTNSKSIPELANARFILSVADHRRHKNLPLLVRATSYVHKRLPTSQRPLLVMVGQKGPATDDILSAIAQTSMQRHVVMLHNITDAELHWLYCNCALLATPSSIEGFCLPVVEALKCGARVVASDLPVVREITGDACSYFNPNGPAPERSLADAILSTRASATAHLWDDERFSLAGMRRKYAELYSGLLSRTPIDPNAIQKEPELVA